jgi:hypothetical protein
MLDISINAIIRSLDAYTGEITKETKVHNLVTNSGLEFAAKILGGLNTNFKAIAIGTNDTTPANGDTALNTEYVRALATIAYEASYKVKFSHTFTVGSGVSEVINEAGVFDSSTVSGSNMLDRLIFDAHTLDTDNPLDIQITITVGRV